MQIKKQMSELPNNRFVVRGIIKRDEQLLKNWLTDQDNIFKNDLKWEGITTKTGAMFFIKCVNTKHDDIQTTKLAVRDFLTDVIDCEFTTIPQNWEQIPKDFRVVNQEGNDMYNRAGTAVFCNINAKLYNGGNIVPNELAEILLNKIKSGRWIIQEIKSY